MIAVAFIICFHNVLHGGLMLRHDVHDIPCKKLIHFIAITREVMHTITDEILTFLYCSDKQGLMLACE